MLTRLLPDQISRLWDIIKYAIEQSVPPATGEHPDKMNRILSAALCGKIDIWASYIKQEGKAPKFEGIAVTETLYDDASGIKNLLIYSIYGYEDSMNNANYTEGITNLAKYGKSIGCTNIVAYSQDSGIAALAKRLGGDVSYFISFNIEKIVQKFNGLEEI